MLFDARSNKPDLAEKPVDSSEEYRPEAPVTRRVLLTVHGIRTFGQWSSRLLRLVKSENPAIETAAYEYGYFSVFAFLIPPFRVLAVWRFRRKLRALAKEHEGAVFDIVAHSFGTHIIGWALRRPLSCTPRVDTLILAGSVLRSGFDWSRVLSTKRVGRIINECGINDDVLIFSQLFVLFTGMAGRIGFRGTLFARLVNRFHRGGHSLYFEGDEFMRKHWVPLLTMKADVELIDERRGGNVSGAMLWVLQNMEVLKLVAYVVVPCAIAWHLYDRAQTSEALTLATHGGAMIAHGRSSTAKGLAMTIESLGLHDTDIAASSLEKGLTILAKRFASWELGQEVSALATTRDGRVLFVATVDGTITAYETQTRKARGSFEFQPGITTLAVSDDGSKVFASSDGEMVIWSPAGDAEPVTFNLFRDVLAARFTPDHRKLLILSRYGLPSHPGAQLSTMDSGSGEMLDATDLEPGPVSAGAISPDSTMIATATTSAGIIKGQELDTPLGAVRLWEVGKDEPSKELKIFSEVSALAISKDNRTVAAGDVFGHTGVWSVEDGYLMYESYQQAQIDSLQFSNFVSELAFPRQMSVEQWMKDQTIERSLEEGLSFYPRSLVASVAHDGSVSVINIGQREETALIPNRRPVNGVTFSPYDDEIVTASGHALQTWKTSTSESSSMAMETPIATITWGPLAKTVLAVGQTGIYRGWNRESGSPSIQISLFRIGGLSIERHIVQARVAVARDAIWLMAIDDEEPFKEMFWNGVTGLPMGANTRDAEVRTLAVSANGKFTAAGLADGSIVLTALSEPISEQKLFAQTAISALALSPDGQWVVAGDESGVVNLWDTASGKHRVERHHAKIVQAVVDPSGSRVAIVDEIGVITVSELASGAELFSYASPAPVEAIALSAQGRLAIAATKFEVFDVASHRLLAHKETDVPTREMLFTPDGEAVFYVVNNQILVWPWNPAVNLSEVCARIRPFLKDDDWAQLQAVHPLLGKGVCVQREN